MISPPGDQSAIAMGEDATRPLSSASSRPTSKAAESGPLPIIKGPKPTFLANELARQNSASMSASSSAAALPAQPMVTPRKVTATETTEEQIETERHRGMEDLPKSLAPSPQEQERREDAVRSAEPVAEPESVIEPVTTETALAAPAPVLASLSSTSLTTASSSSSSSPSIAAKEEASVEPVKAAEPNPLAWYQITDPQTKRTFYANPTSGECAWTLPPDAVLTPRDEEGEWWELFDEKYKLPYYYHTLSQKTDWARPTKGTVIPLITIQVGDFRQAAVLMWLFMIVLRPLR